MTPVTEAISVGEDRYQKPAPTISVAVELPSTYTTQACNGDNFTIPAKKHAPTAAIFILWQAADNTVDSEGPSRLIAFTISTNPNASPAQHVLNLFSSGLVENAVAARPLDPKARARLPAFAKVPNMPLLLSSENKEGPPDGFIC
jgi:hypothetical protein